MASDILEKIISTKAEEVIAAQVALPFAEIERAAHAAPAPRGFERALRSRVAAGRSAAERLGLGFEHRHVGLGPFAEAVTVNLPSSRKVS